MRIPRIANDRSEAGQSTFIYNFLGARGLNTGILFDAGANTPSFQSNSYLFLKSGWRGLLCEPSDLRFSWSEESPGLNIEISSEMIKLHSDGLCEVLVKYSSTKDRVDLLFLDIDGGEYGLIDGLLKRSPYRPFVICAEYNNVLPLDIIFTPNKICHGLQASARGFLEMMRGHDYYYVGMFRGDIIFSEKSFFELTSSRCRDDEERRFLIDALQNTVDLKLLIFGENAPIESFKKINGWIVGIDQSGNPTAASKLASHALRSCIQLETFRHFYTNHRSNSFFSELQQVFVFYSQQWVDLFVRSSFD